MSEWTHVNFMAEIRWHKCKSKTELKEQIERAIGDVGEYITGSEGGVNWYVNIPNCCSSLFQGKKTTYYWDVAYLTCAGHLRDRTKERTEKEIHNFIEYKLKHNFIEIRNLTYKVYGDGEELSWFQEDDDE